MRSHSAEINGLRMHILAMNRITLRSLIATPIFFGIEDSLINSTNGKNHCGEFMFVILIEFNEKFEFQYLICGILMFVLLLIFSMFIQKTALNKKIAKVILVSLFNFLLCTNKNAIPQQQN